jgi:uncharacterized protein (UPF0335 family)
MMPPEDIAAIRGLLQEALVPLRAEVEKLSGLPQTVQDLGNEVVRLRSVVERLEPRAEELAGDIRNAERVLRKLAPQLDRFQVIADYTMPEFIDRLEKLTAEHVSMKTEIKRVERESLRAAAAGEDA